MCPACTTAVHFVTCRLSIYLVQTVVVINSLDVLCEVHLESCNPSPQPFVVQSQV